MGIHDAVQEHVNRHAGVSLLFGVRRPSSLERITDYRIVVASESPLSRSFADETVSIIREHMGDETLRVEVFAVPLNWMSDKAKQ